MIIDCRRHLAFEVRRIRKDPKAGFFLILIANERRLGRPVDASHRGMWHIPFEHGGEAACTPPDWRTCYSVPFRKLPEAVQDKVRACVAYIEQHGTPMENDDSIFDYENGG